MGPRRSALLVARDGRVLDEVQVPTPHDERQRVGRRRPPTCSPSRSSDLSRASRASTPRQVPIGIGLPGMMRRDGRLAFAPNLQIGVGRGPRRAARRRRSRVRLVFCENDANCAALWRARVGRGRGIDDFVMVTLGTGIGGGVIADGELVRGRSGFAGEIGHMVVEARGAPCLLRRPRLLGALRLGWRSRAPDPRSGRSRAVCPTLVARNAATPRRCAREDVTARRRARASTKRSS